MDKGEDLTECMLAALSINASIRINAEARLRCFKEENLPLFLVLLSWELANDRKPNESRRLAGILLKNSLDAKDDARKELIINQWITVHPTFRVMIKDALLFTLASCVPEPRHASAQVIAKIASIEIPKKEWPEFIGLLLTNMTQKDVSPMAKQATLQTLGYLCEEVSHQDLLQQEVDSILTAIVHGMNSAEHNAEIRLTATKALCNALYFAETNFKKEVERNYIIKSVSKTALISQEAEIRQAAFECLVLIASLYYDVMEPYMQTMFELTSTAIRGSEEGVALQAIEFWSSICDEEIERQDFKSPSSENFKPSHCHFIERALPYLVPLLLQTLLKQEDNQDLDHNVWNISVAGGTCLVLVAITVGDAIIPHVIQFVKTNIKKPDWHHREAAFSALGAILEGPTTENLYPIGQTVLGIVLNGMRDENKHVRNITAWTLGRIFELLHSPARGVSVISHESLPGVVAVLLESIEDVPHVAEKVCRAIYKLAQSYENAGAISSVLSPYISEIIKHLLATADREDVSDSKLSSFAYEALSAVVRCSNVTETSNIIVQLLTVIMTKLEHILRLQISSSDDQEKIENLKASICGVLHVIIQKLGGTDDTRAVMMQKADQIMMLLLRAFACSPSMMHEKTMLAVGALAYATGPEFEKYMLDLYRYLEMGLQNFKEYQVCAVTVGVVGDIFRVLKEKLLPFCDPIMALLLKDLRSDKLDWSVKPPIFSCIGDIALAIGNHFEKYGADALLTMEAATQISANMDTSYEVSRNRANQLRGSIFEASSGILQGFKGARPDILLPYAQNLLGFIELVFRDEQRDGCVTRAAVTTMGDLADSLGPNTKPLFRDFPFCAEFINQCLQSDDEKLKRIAGWSQIMIGNVLAS